MGSIPACAGEPFRFDCWSFVFKVYPRVCGGTILLFMAGLPVKGLSPRVRGNLQQWQSELALGWSIPACAGEPILSRTPFLSFDRSIPACAGEPGRSHCRRARSWVYPRVCGGTNRALSCAPSPEGLSPRVRGNLSNALVPRYSIRSIPACAGEPHRSRGGRGSRGVYPRVCGGTGQSARCENCSTGLSPRVRGNPGPACPPIHARRSIPACAGEPLRRLHCGAQRWVYPRVCGGTCWARSKMASSTGLSPRVRGNLVRSVCGCSRLGSIPACAGEPLLRGRCGSVPRVYPRVCGGTRTTAAPTPTRQGLSPRVRGNRNHITILASR